MVRDLVESAIDMVRSEREAEVEDLAHERVDERLLDLLLPPPGAATAPAQQGAAPGATPGDGAAHETPQPPARPAPASSPPSAADDALGVFLVSGAGTVT